MKHLIAARSDKDKLLSFPHQGWEHLLEKTDLILGGFIRARVNPIIGEKNKASDMSK